MTSLQNHVPKVVVVETLFVSNDVEGNFGCLVCDMGGYLDGEPCVVEINRVYRYPRDTDVLGEEHCPWPSTPHQFILALDYGLGLVDCVEV